MFKIIKESSEEIVTNDGRILYYGELRGFRYQDGTEIQISNFSSNGTYQLSWWDNGERAGSATKYGDLRNAMMLIERIISDGYETADEAFYANC